MKAKEEPEKIYRRREGKYIKYYDYKPAKISYDEKEPTEYIRTDAIKAKKVKLTWMDMRQIVAISDRMLIQKGNLDDKGFYEAVLEQFNKAQKGE